MSGGVVRAAGAAAEQRMEVWLRFAAALTLLLTCAGAAHAGNGGIWTFEVLEFSRIDRDEHLIRLLPRPAGKKFPQSCETFVVHARFDLETWSPAGRHILSREDHERSLRLLEQAQVTHDIIRFGAVRRGFGAIPESPRCEVASLALYLVVNREGSAEVYSFFEEPPAPSDDPSAR